MKWIAINIPGDNIVVTRPESDGLNDKEFLAKARILKTADTETILWDLVYFELESPVFLNKETWNGYIDSILGDETPESPQVQHSSNPQVGDKWDKEPTVY